MKIAILTFTNGTNIGQRLQNYALQTTIQKISGAEVYTIIQGYPFNKTKQKIRVVLHFLRNPKKKIAEWKREKKFKQFNEHYISFFKMEMPFSGNNTSFAEFFDLFVVGSDQIWNPYSPFVGENFFLTFANRQQRLTYAPSFSADDIPEERREEYRSYLVGFDSITTREYKGAEIIKKISGIDATVVLDPTLLLDVSEYNKIKKTCIFKPSGNYILAMFLGRYPEFEIQGISDILKMQILCIDSDAIIGPDEFIDLIEKADLVLTDSYHVTIFSILYQRPFVNFMRSGNGEKMNSRFLTLYQMLGIKQRTWSEVKDNFNDVLDMDYKYIYQRLESEKKRCLAILSEDLNRKCNLV